MKTKDFYKDLRQYMKEYGMQAIDAYERGLVTLDEVFKLAHETELARECLIYHGFVIEHDKTIETEVYYIRRVDGEKWEAMDGTTRSIESLQDNLDNVKEYIDCIEA